MIGPETAQWNTDNDRLLLAAMSGGEELFGLDWTGFVAVQDRCIARFGQPFGIIYFRDLVATLPERKPELFPELVEFRNYFRR